jgi:hypothetical protein
MRGKAEFGLMLSRYLFPDIVFWNDAFFQSKAVYLSQSLRGNCHAVVIAQSLGRPPLKISQDSKMERNSQQRFDFNPFRF